MPKIFALLILLSLCWSCTKEELNPPCTLHEYNFEANGWTPIDASTDIGCAFYLEAFSWNNDIYYAVGSHCADMALIPFLGCTGERICELPQSKTCTRFFNKKVNLGIVAYRKL
ncbi:MAG: hypothetical protein Sapg2KO_48050 [Saprospiraceae bacterium]